MNTYIDTIIELSSEFGAHEEALYESYSGRGMYGKTCYGIVTDDPDGLIEAAAEAGVKGACTDSMGVITIVYWPRIKGE